MADVHTPKQRSYNMSRIGNKNTKPEEKVLEFVNKKWLPYANQQLEKIAA